MIAAGPSKGTVLFVEDERDTREVLAGAMERAGYRCVAAASVNEAIDKSREAGFVDVVVTDLVLGDDDRGGLRLMTELKEAGVRAPVIVITAYADVDKVKWALNHGTAHLLEKPFRAQALIDAVDHVRAQGGDVRHAMEQVLTRAELTDKERVVARHLLEGLSYGEIAALERNSTATIRQHVSRVYAKCGVASRGELFRLVYVR